ncbi:MAG TPA: type VI secretion system tube protein Hcp [Rudaea sp.]|nr:type VI secretion system tube protein Hcp [Rudaea sp.]
MMRICILLCFLIASSSAFAATQTTAFTYQGHLLQNGTPTSGSHNLVFTLWDSSSGGAQVGSTITQNNYPVANGVFNIDLDFGASVFNGQQRYLDVSVDGTELTPRQPVNSTPVAIFAMSAANGTSVSGTTSSSQFTNDHLYTGIGVVGQNFPMVMFASPSFVPAGTSTQLGYTNAVDVFSLTSSLSATVSFGGTKGGTETNPTGADIRVLAALDPANIAFITNLVNGRSFTKLQVDVLDNTGKASESYCYGAVFVSEIQPMPQPGVVEMRFVPTTIGYRMGQGGSAQIGFNLTTGMTTDAPCIK